MQALELRIPPPAVMLVTACAMWGVAWLTPVLDVPAMPRMAMAAAVALVGLAFAVAGGISFKQAKTTSNPLRPERATSLVRSGVYRITRNPMYVSLVLLLFAWAVFLACLWTLPVPLAFMLYIRRFQILPEERALAAKFGGEYADYQESVRRWL